MMIGGEVAGGIDETAEDETAEIFVAEFKSRKTRRHLMQPVDFSESLSGNELDSILSMLILTRNIRLLKQKRRRYCLWSLPRTCYAERTGHAGGAVERTGYYDR